MIDLYTFPTPNGWKAQIMLEETGLEYKANRIHIGEGDQFQPEFLKISPNNKIPAIVDHNGPGGKPISIFESGAILLYLAEKSGMLMPQDIRGRYLVMQWLMFQVGGQGPMLGQAHHFRIYAKEKIPYAIDRYTNEAARLYGVMNKRLGEAEYLAEEYTIADIAAFPWISRHERQGQNLEDFPNLKRWYDVINARKQVQAGLAVFADIQLGIKPSDEQHKNMFQKNQFDN